MNSDRIKAQAKLAQNRMKEYYEGMPSPTNEEGWKEIREKAIEGAKKSSTYYINVLIEHKRIKDLEEILEELDEENDKSTIGARYTIRTFLKQSGGGKRHTKRRHTKKRKHTKRRHTKRRHTKRRHTKKRTT